MGLCIKTIHGWRDGVGTMSDDGWEAGIYTGPDFGCVHFEDDSLTDASTFTRASRAPQ